MWIVKGTFLGAWLFAFGTVGFLYFGLFRNLPPLSAVSLNLISMLTTQNGWWWVALVTCIVLGLALVRSWPGKPSPALWAALIVTSVVPLGLLRLVSIILSKAKALQN
jgi:hypothetical protein